MNFNGELDNIMVRIESIVSDPLNAISDAADVATAGGINNLLSRFFRSYSELSLNPESPEVRMSVIEHSRSLAETFSTVANDLVELKSDLNEQVKYYVDVINQIISDLVMLNRGVARSEAMPNFNANDFRDRRDVLLGELSEIVPVNVVESKEGIVNVSIAGQWLVDNLSTNEFITEIVDEEGLGVVSVRLGEKGLYVIDDAFRTGKLGAIFDARDRIVNDLITDVDVLARTVMFEVNKIHSESSGIEGYTEIRSNLTLPESAIESDTIITLERIFNNPQESSRVNFIRNRPYTVEDGTINIRVADSENNTKDVYKVQISKDDTMYDVIQRIDRSDGIVNTVQTALTFDPVFVNKALAVNGAEASESGNALSSLSSLAGTAIADTPGSYSFEIHLREVGGALVDSNLSTQTYDPFVVTFSDSDTLNDLASAIQTTNEGRIRANVVPSTDDPTVSVIKISTVESDETISLQNDTSGIIQAFGFPLTDPSRSLIGGNVTESETMFTGLSTDSIFGTGNPAFSPAFPGPPPSVLVEGSFELVVLDNNNVPTITTISIGAAGVDTMADLETAIEAADSNLSVDISTDNTFKITTTNNRSFFFQNDTSGLIEAMGFSDIKGTGKIGDQQFQEGSFEFVIANQSGKVTHIFEVPVSADPSVVGGVFSLNGIVDRINSSANGAGAPIRASIVEDVTDPNTPSRNHIQIEAGAGYEFTFRSDNSHLLAALGLTEGPILDQTRDNPIRGAEFPVGVGDDIGGRVRAQIVDEDQYSLSTAGGDQISFVGDSSHFLAATGINVLFLGSDGESMRVNTALIDNPYLLGASLDGTKGNNDSALAVVDLEDKDVIDGRTIGEYYRTTIARLGNEGARIQQSLSTNETVLNEMESLQQQDSGVSLDEESINLIRFQQAYQASARFISTIDRLMDVVINQMGV